MAGNEGNPEALINWYNDGADGQIDWGSPGDFEQCVEIAGQHVSDPEGFCAERHHDATGEWPGKGAHGGAAAEVLDAFGHPTPGALPDRVSSKRAKVGQARRATGGAPGYARSLARRVLDAFRSTPAE
jgi:hypothetical protein